MHIAQQNQVEDCLNIRTAGTTGSAKSWEEIYQVFGPKSWDNAFGPDSNSSLPNISHLTLSVNLFFPFCTFKTTVQSRHDY